MTPILECKSLSKQYTKGVLALNQLDFALERGQIVGLLGPNGSGKTTLIKIINDLLTPTNGKVLVDGKRPGVYTKKIVSYLPERSYLENGTKVKDALRFFEDFYEDFKPERAKQMLEHLDISLNSRFRAMSKGTREKLQLVLVMSRDAQLYVLDEPIGGVDPAARDYILKTILENYNPEATILLSTHLIQDIENILDRVIFLKEGKLVLNMTVDAIRMNEGKSVDTLFREVFKC